ncbi:hypothetical protein PPYR_00062 [Photinus pyralis]|uniref:Uncharacterized protein n=1 Tax=Photinus pyralis TaxID=7054 RepID=A0A5N4B0H3_PHOPY|nr:hypothetical protein PPYR_00062 [Photinus pyralis]
MSPTSYSQPNTPQSNASSVKSVSTVAKSKKPNCKKVDRLPEILKEYINDKKRSRLEKSTARADAKDNSILDFFINMGKTVATFPPLEQASNKRQVFQIVNSYELQLLGGTTPTQSLFYMQNQPSTSFHPPSSYFHNQQPQSASTCYEKSGSHAQTLTNQNIVQAQQHPSPAPTEQSSSSIHPLSSYVHNPQSQAASAYYEKSGSHTQTLTTQQFPPAAATEQSFPFQSGSKYVMDPILSFSFI